MNSIFIVTRSFKHTVDCFCSDKQHSSLIPFQRGDRIELTDDTKVVEPLGWYVRIIINNDYQVYVHIDDLEKMHERAFIQSEFDLELERNFFTYKVNTSLDEKDQVTFHTYVNKLHEVTHLLEKKLECAQ